MTIIETQSVSAQIPITQGATSYKEINQMHRIIILKKVLVWVIFTVLISLIPFLLRYLGSIFIHKPIDLETILSKGELLLVATAVASSALGELLANSHRNGIAKLVIAGFCILSILLSSLCFAFIQGLGDASFSLNTDKAAIGQWSLWIFGSAFLTGLGCIILSEEK